MRKRYRVNPGYVKVFRVNKVVRSFSGRDDVGPETVGGVVRVYPRRVFEILDNSEEREIKMVERSIFIQNNNNNSVSK